MVVDHNNGGTAVAHGSYGYMDRYHDDRLGRRHRQSWLDQYRRALYPVSGGRLLDGYSEYFWSIGAALAHGGLDRCTEQRNDYMGRSNGHRCRSRRRQISTSHKQLGRHHAERRTDSQIRSYSRMDRLGDDYLGG